MADALQSLQSSIDALNARIDALHGLLKPNNPRILRLPEVLELVGLRTSRVYDLMKLGQFPQPYKLVEGGHAIGWRAEEVEAWILARAKREPMEAAE